MLLDMHYRPTNVSVCHIDKTIHNEFSVKATTCVPHTEHIYSGTVLTILGDVTVEHAF